MGKLAAYQPTGRQRFHLCCKWQATAQSRYKRLIYQGIGSMQHHVAVTAFHLHHPAFQLIATAGTPIFIIINISFISSVQLWGESDFLFLIG